jgi:hypothetical protein
MGTDALWLTPRPWPSFETRASFDELKSALLRTRDDS